MIYHTIYIALLILLSFMLLACLIRAVRGPLVADRLMAVNMMGTMVMVMIAILALMLREGYLVDICLIYAMISFLAVVVISKVYIGIYEERCHTASSRTDIVSPEDNLTAYGDGMVFYGDEDEAPLEMRCSSESVRSSREGGGLDGNS